MSATIYWQPIEPQHLMNSADSVISALRHAFGDMPIELDMKALNTLAGMAATWTSNDINPYQVIADAIVECGRIRVWSEY